MKERIKQILFHAPLHRLALHDVAVGERRRQRQGILRSCRRKSEMKNDAPLEDVDRRFLPGFLEYFSQRPLHFTEIFGEVYTEENATSAWASMKLLPFLRKPQKTLKPFAPQGFSLRKLPDKFYFRPDEVAGFLSISQRRVQRYCQAGTISAVRIGQTYRIPQREVTRLMKIISSL